MNPYGPPEQYPHATQHMHPQTQAPQQPMPPQRIAVGPPIPPQPRRRRRVAAVVVRDIVQALALMVAAVWGGYTFIYKEIVVPARRPASLVVTPMLEAIGRRGDTVLAKATFHMVNRSDSKVYTPAIWYSVRGLKLQGTAVDDTTYLRQIGDAAEKPYPTSRFSEFTAADLIGAGKVATEVETWYEPGAEQTVEQLLYIPADRYDAAQLQVQYLISKDVHDVKNVRWRTTATGDLEPRLVFQPGSRYGTAALTPAALSDTSTRYVRWLRTNQGGVSYVTATLSLWRGSPTTAAAAAAAASPAPQ